jgi:DNA-binding MarR family transcriptional regulator
VRSARTSAGRASATKTAIDLPQVMVKLLRRLRAERPAVSAGLTLSQLSALSHLEHGGAMTTSDLAAAEYVRPQSMAVTVASLVGAGLVRRAGDQADKRRVMVSLTARGRAALVGTRQTQGEWLAHAILTRLDRDEQRMLVDAVRILDRLANAPSGVASTPLASSVGEP